jgi:serine protease Do
MQKSTKQAISFSVLIAAAVIFGMVVAGSVNVTPRLEAQKDPAPKARTAPVAVPSFADIADEAMPSVVSITSTDIVRGSSRRYGSPFGGGDTDPFEFFFGQPPRGNRDRRGQPRDDDEHKEQQSGTGFLISEDGYIVTNNHVIDGADKIEVRHEKDRFTAKVVGRDPATDLALLKVDSKQRFTPLPLGNSDNLRVGEWVMAIGDPIIFDKTVTVGVVSAKDRQGISADQTTRSFENFIQTDAAINLGNSGGPLINVSGEVVGINTAIYRPAQNIGFAVPVNTLKTVLPQLKDKGKVVRGYLGINIENVDNDKQAAFKLKSTNGAFVQSVLQGEPADAAGIKPGDTIVQVDNQPVKDTRELIGYVSSKAPGSKVKLTVVRDGHEMTLTAALAERGSDGASSAEKGSSGADESRGRLGLSVEPVTPQIRKSLGVEASVDGLYVDHVKEVSPAFDAGIRDGDIITQVNGKAVTSTDEFSRIVKATPKGEYLRLYVFKPQAKVSLFALVKIED